MEAGVEPARPQGRRSIWEGWLPAMERTIGCARSIAGVGLGRGWTPQGPSGETFRPRPLPPHAWDEVPNVYGLGLRKTVFRAPLNPTPMNVQEPIDHLLSSDFYDARHTDRPRRSEPGTVFSQKALRGAEQ